MAQITMFDQNERTKIGIFFDAAMNQSRQVVRVKVEHGRGIIILPGTVTIVISDDAMTSCCQQFTRTLMMERAR